MPKTAAQNEEIKRVTVEKIKEAALVCFAQKGLVATNIADIARRAEISVGLLYHYYKSKEELYRALVTEAICASDQAITGGDSSDVSPTEALREMVHQVMVGLTGESAIGAYYYALMTQVTSNPEVAAIEQQYREKMYAPFNHLVELIKRGQQQGEFRSGEPTALAIMLLASFNGLFTYKLMFGKQFVAPKSKWIEGMIIKN